jgi:ectoine hydroxylase-related dioxygenase (phytanoyl-CoA dioxygenase family)
MLTPEELSLFHEQGFFLSEPLFSDAEITDLKLACDTLTEIAQGLEGTVIYENSQFVVSPREQGSEQRTRIHRVVWCGGAQPQLLRLGQTHPLISRVTQLLGSKSLVHIINQIHFKYPGDEVQFPFHQDSRHRGYGTNNWIDVTGTGSYIQTLCAIDEVTEDNGPLLIVPHSHKQGHLDLKYSNYFEEELEDFDVSAAISVPMQPGQVLFWGPYLIHGSRENKSKSSRRVFINGFAYPGANHKDYPGCGKGVTLTL